MATFDAVLVGSGINTLTAGALLAREAGASACSRALRPLRRRDPHRGRLHPPGVHARGAEPWHPLFMGSAAYGELGDELHRRGLEYVNTELPTATAFPDGSAMFLQTTMEANVAEFDRWADGDGAAWQRQFEGSWRTPTSRSASSAPSLWSPAGLGLGRRMLRRFGRHGLLDFAGQALATCRDWTTATFRSEQAHGLPRTVVLHTGLGPDNAVSGFMTQVIACAGPARRDVGPGRRRREARRRARRNRPRCGGELRTDAHVERITVSSGRATGVVLAGGETVGASRAVVAGVTPTQLYGTLLAPGGVREDVRAAAERYRYGRGDAVHLALDELPRWRGPDAERLAKTAIVHHARARRGLARGERGRARPCTSEATIVVGQPSAPSIRRARPTASGSSGSSCRSRPPDASGATPRARSTSATEPDRGGPRGVRRPDRRTARRVDREPRRGDSPARRPLPRRPRGPELQPRRATSTRGAARSTRTSLAPFAAAPGHGTTIEGLWHVGASTHLGPGLGAGSGYLVAKELTKPPLPRRVLAKLPGRS